MTHGIYRIFQYVPGVQQSGILLCEKINYFLEKHCIFWKVIPIIAIYTYFLFWYALGDIQWLLWRRMLIDYLLIVAFPLYVAIFSEIINDIYEYSVHENQNIMNDIDTHVKDVYFSVWEEEKYYQFLSKKDLKPCNFGCNEANILKELRKYIADTEPELKE